MPKTLCQQHPGQCMGDPACGDRLCPGHPVQAQGRRHLERCESAARASRMFRPDFGVEGPHRRLSLLQRRQVGVFFAGAAVLAVVVVALALAFHHIHLSNLFR